MPRRRRPIAAGAALSLMLAGAAAKAAGACDEAAARDRLAQLQAALMRPESMAAMDAAKADFAADQQFDNPRDARYLAAAAVYFKAERQLDAGAVDDACVFLEQASGLIDTVVAGE